MNERTASGRGPRAFPHVGKWMSAITEPVAATRARIDVTFCLNDNE